MLTLAVAPLILITGLLTGYFIWSGQTVIQDSFLSKGKEINRYLAKVSEFPMFSGDTEALRLLGTATITENQVESVTFFDTDRQILVQIGKGTPATPLSASTHKGEDRWLFQQPITYQALEVDDYPAARQAPSYATDEGKVLGWVQLSINDSLLSERQAYMLYTSIGIAIMGLLVTILMATHLGRSITRPLSKLSDTVKQLESGNLSARAPQLRGHEFSILAAGLNRMAERIEHVTEELQQRVNQATAQLTETLDNLEQQNRKLETARNELLIADRAKDEFLARMSHELRTPLTSILGYSELLKSEALTEQQHKFNHIINQSSDLLLAIINDILDFTQLRSNAITLEAQPFNLENCVENLIAMHAHGAFSKGLELVLIIESDVPTEVIGDSLRLKQIINNLLSNAIKFTAHGHVVVRLSVESQTAHQATLIIQVKDSGIGISQQELARLFNEFSQANVSISRRFGGSGLGLAIVKRLTQLMHGDVTLNSNKGQGTEANCQIRVQINPAYQRPTPSLVCRQSPLLICDQNPWARRGLRHLALQYSHQITALTARSALWQRISQPGAHFDVLIIGLLPAEVAEAPIRSLLQQLRRYTDAPLLLAGGTMQASLQGNTELWEEFQPLIFISKPPPKKLFIEQLAKLAKLKPNQMAPPATTPAAGNQQTQSHALAGARILVAEDNRYNRELVTRFLTNAGATVTEVENGEQAALQVKKQPFDMVLLDFNMPQLGGVGAARIIRALRLPNTPKLFALTAAIVGNYCQQDELQLFDDLISKPVSQENLIHSLATVWTPATALRTTPGLLKVSQTALHAEIKRLADKLTGAQEREQIKYFAHQLRGILDAQCYGEITSLLLLIEKLAMNAQKAVLRQYIDNLAELLAARFNIFS